MFSRKKAEKPKRRSDVPRTNASLTQFGLLEVSDIDNLGQGGEKDTEDDDDLEAELLALCGDDGGGRGGVSPTKQRNGKSPIDPNVLQKMVADCMSDQIADDLSDEEDPELLAELSALTPEETTPSPKDPSPTSPNISTPGSTAPTSPEEPPRERNPEPFAPRSVPVAAGASVLALLKERINMYERAEASAIVAGDSSRARRFGRGLKTLQQMTKTVASGQSINEEDIPPPVIYKERQPPPPDIPKETPRETLVDVPHNLWDNIQSLDDQRHPIQTTIPQTIAFPNDINQSGLPQREPTALDILRIRESQYKMAALEAKRSGNKELAVSHMRTMKQVVALIGAAEAGQQIDGSMVPAEPGGGRTSSVKRQPSVDPTQQSTPAVAVANTQDSAESGNDGPKSAVEALEQRLEKYTQQRDKAKNDGNARKVRMNERIMKQYQEALRDHQLGKHVDFNELPTPPGFPPIPTGLSAAAPPTAAPAVAPSQDNRPDHSNSSTEAPPAKQPKAAAPAPAPSINVRKTPQSRVEKQLAFLTKRQQQFKKAALESKKRGEIEQAKEYLRNSKGLEQLIEASRNGLPVDLNTVPVPPQDQVAPANLDFEVVEADDCIMAPPKTDTDIAVMYTKLEQDLIDQIKMCAQTREHFKAIGDVASANRFEQLILHTKKDLDAVRAGFKRGRTPPKFHYETRSFNIIQCNTDLNDNDCEVTIIRGINYNVPNPSDVDTYIKIEFPYPTDYPPQDKSDIVKDTNNPEYNFKSLFSIDRKSRALARLFKRHCIKLEVIAKGGWFSRSTTVGTVKVPLVELETKCTLHDSFNLLDDRKKVAGGKLEVRVRLRNPIVSKELKKVTEKWLVIEGF